MKRADKPVVVVNGDNNEVEVNINITSTESKIPVFIVAAFIATVMMTVLAVSFCCPELLADFIRWIVSVAIDS